MLGMVWAKQGLFQPHFCTEKVGAWGAWAPPPETTPGLVCPVKQNKCYTTTGIQSFLEKCSGTIYFSSMVQ